MARTQSAYLQIRLQACSLLHEKGEPLQKSSNKVTPDVLWQPFPGPQTAAYQSDADQIGYGGAAAGGKSDFQLGVAGTKHRKAIIFRRVFPSLRGLIERSREVFNPVHADRSDDSYNEQLHRWKFSDGRMVEFGAVQFEKDLKKFQGQPHDYIGFDEATEIPEHFVRFLMGWNRTSDPNQQCRVVFTFNPPIDEEGAWVIKFFAPWLDDEYHDPALDGEIRYVAHFNNEDHFYRSPEDAPEQYRAHLKRRTFFHAYLDDNPVMVASGYATTIETLPEPLRSILKGDFKAGRRPDPWQLIPAAWVDAAIERWKAMERNTPLVALGVDVAREGIDNTVIAPLHQGYVDTLQSHPDTDTGGKTVGLVKLAWDGKAIVGLDYIGVGSSPYDILKDEKVPVMAFVAGASSDATDKMEVFKFADKRAEAYWMLREALDPEGDILLALPDDKELKADICAPRWKLVSAKVRVEKKDDIKKRIKRSPDKGDAVAIAVWASRQKDKQSWNVWDIQKELQKMRREARNG